MINIGIHFDVNDFTRWLYAVKRVKRAVIREKNNLPRRFAVEYYQLVHRNIVNQVYTGNYPEYAEFYYHWKLKYGKTMDFWRLYDALLNNLRAFKVKGDQPGEVAYMGGIDDSASVGGKKIAMYGSAVELGTFGPGTKVKPRPVFKPTALEYAEGEWEKKNYESLDRIVKEWR